MTEDKPQKSIQAGEFRVVDSQGRLRALLCASESWNGDPRLDLLDKQGLPRLTLQLADGLPSAAFFLPNGQPLISAGNSAEGELGVMVCYENGSPSFQLVVKNNGEVEAMMYDRAGNLVWHAPQPAGSEGSPRNTCPTGP